MITFYKVLEKMSTFYKVLEHTYIKLCLLNTVIYIIITLHNVNLLRYILLLIVLHYESSIIMIRLSFGMMIKYLVCFLIFIDYSVINYFINEELMINYDYILLISIFDKYEEIAIYVYDKLTAYILSI